MSSLGIVIRNPQTGAFKGVFKTLRVNAEIDIIPIREKPAAHFPDYRIMSSGVELGAGWLNRGQLSGNEYVSLTFAHPDIGPSVIKCQLGKAARQDDEDVYAIIWNPEG
jgi:uncharacterized protein (DUF736 family)